jgi:hypothetical protein
LTEVEAKIIYTSTFKIRAYDFIMDNTIGSR